MSKGKVYLVLDLIESKGKITEQELMNELLKTKKFEVANYAGQVTLPEVELILQDLLLADIIRIKTESPRQDFWIPASTKKEIQINSKKRKIDSDK